MGCKTGLLSRPVKWGPIKWWARHRQTSQPAASLSLTHRPDIFLFPLLLCFAFLSIMVSLCWILMRCCCAVFFLGWRSLEVTSPGWQSVPISTMRLLTLATFRWVLQILMLWLLQQRVTMFSNFVFGSCSVALLVNCSRNASALKCSVALESISLFVFFKQFHPHYFIFLLFPDMSH